MIARLAGYPLLVVLLGATALLAMLPATHALVTDDNEAARNFFYSSLVLMIITMMLGIATGSYAPRNAARSHLTALAGAYLLLPLAMALPFSQAVPDTTLVNAWFEMVSAFTTTGATVYDPGRLPESVHLWRATVGWFGGFFILLAGYAILAPLNLGGVEVISGRVPGRGANGATQITRVAEPAERITRFALQIFPIYSGFTIVLWIGLLIAGDGAVIALTHAMATLSTSGISSGEGLASSQSGFAGEVMIFAFFAFALTRRCLPGTGLVDRNQRLLDDPELRVAGFVILIVPVVLFLRHWVEDDPHGSLSDPVAVLSAIWGAIFTASSFLTTTGFESASWTSTGDWSGLGAPVCCCLALP